MARPDIAWNLDEEPDHPPESLLALEPEPGYLLRYAGSVRPRGAERIEVTLWAEGILSVRLRPVEREESMPDSLRDALETLARSLPRFKPPPPEPPGSTTGTTPDPGPDVEDPPNYPRG